MFLREGSLNSHTIHRPDQIRRESIGHMGNLILGRASTCMMGTMRKQYTTRQDRGRVVISLHRISKNQRHSPELHRQQTHSHGKQRAQLQGSPIPTRKPRLGPARLRENRQGPTPRQNPHAGKEWGWFMTTTRRAMCCIAIS